MIFSAMILGVGVDILHISRIAAVVRRGAADRFARRILDEREIEQFQHIKGEDEQTRYLATRWGVKEATYKAAYPLHTLRWHDICVFKQGPKLHMTIRWPSTLSSISSHLSISHDHNLLVSYVILEQL